MNLNRAWRRETERFSKQLCRRCINTNTADLLSRRLPEVPQRAGVFFLSVDCLKYLPQTRSRPRVTAWPECAFQMDVCHHLIDTTPPPACKPPPITRWPLLSNSPVTGSLTNSPTCEDISLLQDSAATAEGQRWAKSPRNCHCYWGWTFLQMSFTIVLINLT